MGSGEVTTISTHWCPVEPSGLHRYTEVCKVVCTFHPRCSFCGFINTERIIEETSYGETLQRL